MKKAGLIVDVFRPSYSGMCHQPSNQHDKFILIDDKLPELFSPSDKIPAMIIVSRQLFGEEYLHLVPVSLQGKQTMFGGNFAWTSDSRFRQDISERPLPIHDRVE